MRLHTVALARVRRRWPFSAAVGAGLVVVIALATAASTVRLLADEAGLQSSIRALGPGAAVAITGWGYPLSSQVRVGAFRAGLADALSGASDTLALETVSVGTGPIPPRSGAADGVSLLSVDGLADHAVPVAGTLSGPAGAGGDWFVTGSETAAARLGLSVGQRACFGRADGPAFCARLAGIWRPRDAGETFWRATGPLDRFVTVGEDALFAIVGSLGAPNQNPFPPSAGAVVVPRPAAITLAGIPGLVTQVRRLRARFSVEGNQAGVETNLDAALDDYTGRLAVGEFALRLMTTQLLLVGLAYVAVAGYHSLAQQGSSLAVWRARGVSRAAILRLLAMEWVVLAAAAVPLGVAVGLGAGAVAGRVLLGGGWPPQMAADLPPALLAPVAIVVAASLAVLAAISVWASQRELLDLRRRASRPARAWWQAGYADLGLAALSVPLLGATQVLGTARLRALGLGDTDTVSLVLPGLALLLIALALLRLLPAAGWLARRRSRHPVFALAARNLERRPLEHAPVALLVIAAVALGLFAGAYASSARRNVADRVAYAVGADVRVGLSQVGAAPPGFAAPAGVPGLRVVSPVYRDHARLANITDGLNVLAVDPGTLGSVAWERPGLLGTSLAGAMSRLAAASHDGVPLPGRPDRLLLWANAGGRSLTLTATIDDARGRHCTAGLGSSTGGWQQLTAPIRCAAAPAYPLRFRALAVSAAAAPADSQLALSDLAAAGPAGTVVVERFQDVAGWWASTYDKGGYDRDLDIARRDGRPSGAMVVQAAAGTSYVRPFPGQSPVPALAGRGTLDRLGLTPGTKFDLSIGQLDLTAVVVGQVDLFPTIYPEDGDFLLMDQSALLDHLLHSDSASQESSELWASVDPRQEGRAVAALRALPGPHSVQDAREETAAALADPVNADLRANLVVGFWAAALLALAGFAVHVVVTARGRLSESAILLANGVARGAIARSVLLEHGLVLLFGAAAGTALGLALAWALVPSLELQTGATQTFPPSVLVLDPALTVVAALAVPAAAVLVGWAAGRAAGRVALMRELRGLE